jgi:hypothetical protein
MPAGWTLYPAVPGTECREAVDVDASDALRALARYRYEGDDLRDAYLIAREAIDCPFREGTG